MPDKDQSALREQITRSMRAKETGELLQIWRENDPKQWSDLTFAIVGEILQERLGTIPPQGLPPEQAEIPAAGIRDVRGKGFIPLWLAANLIAWLLATFAFQGDLIFNTMQDQGLIVDAMKGEGVLILSRIGLPLGIVLGILQCLVLGRWKVSKIGWILATTAGWGIPAYEFLQLRNSLLFYDPIHSSGFVTYLQNQWIIFPAVMCLMGAFTGTLQAFVLRNKMRRPGLWILANALSMTLLGFFINGLLVMVEESNRLRGDLLRSVEFWILFAISVAVAALLSSYPAGKVIEKLGQYGAEE